MTTAEAEDAYGFEFRFPLQYFRNASLLRARDRSVFPASFVRQVAALRGAGVAPDMACTPQPGRSRRLEEALLQHRQVREVDDLIPVEIRQRVCLEEHALHLCQIGEVHDAVVVEVAIASVSVAVLVGIELGRIGDGRAVIARIADTVAVAVRLIRVCDEAAVVRAVVRSVVVGVRIVGVGDA